MFLRANSFDLYNDTEGADGSELPAGYDPAQMALIDRARQGAEKYNVPDVQGNSDTLAFDLGQLYAVYHSQGKIEPDEIELVNLVNARITEYEKKNKIKPGVSGTASKVKKTKVTKTAKATKTALKQTDDAVIVTQSENNTLLYAGIAALGLLGFYFYRKTH